MLTEDMTRLCEEIVTLRTRRGELREALQRDSNDRRESVSGLCQQFADDRAEMARRAKSERRSFLRHLRHQVHAVRREMRSDLAGVRKAWVGGAA